ncbi:hypothetical protein PUNSTDRAFT_139409 [Punctularia strigosozonata HHB-11173 SS5]|uniref:Uncharacterized protein n=1 Tax=Punctularia strigosozonata (strain HHB-11173) TaxID=741275 RepID=R7S2Q1_PUNST|nr:uncharacterized protein PUNSTDRAFT_139409 [Punctularia strigosozonata HHB-11173 SS5]EIN03526.1 hypothetical protein PUNSTDRAFT_139409 [Punctularia strigosozonata HHB-11173 SS5]
MAPKKQSYAGSARCRQCMIQGVANCVRVTATPTADKPCDGCAVSRRHCAAPLPDPTDLSEHAPARHPTTALEWGAFMTSILGKWENKLGEMEASLALAAEASQEAMALVIRSAIADIVQESETAQATVEKYSAMNATALRDANEAFRNLETTVSGHAALLRELRKDMASQATAMELIRADLDEHAACIDAIASQERFEFLLGAIRKIGQRVGVEVGTPPPLVPTSQQRSY